MASMMREYTLTNAFGLHARPASILAKNLKGFDCRVTVCKGAACANAKSVMELLVLAAEKGDCLTVSAEGSDAEAALNEVDRVFGEVFTALP